MADERSRRSKVSDDIERLKGKLKNLIEVGKSVSEICQGIHYEARKWTPLKLICLMYYVDMYSRVMSVKRWELGLSQVVYVDPLAGSGTNLVRDTNDVVAGSVPISIVFSRAIYLTDTFSPRKMVRDEGPSKVG